MSENEQIFCSSIIPKPNKIFVYKGEEYQVDFELIKRNCKYFYNRSSEFESQEKYEIDKSIEVNSETIQSFLKCCQNQETKISDFIGLNYLSTKYENEELKAFTEKYIAKHYDELIFQSLSFKCQSNDSEINIDTTKEEEILASHFIEYLEDEQIFSIPIRILYRVMKKFLTYNKEILNNQITKKKFNEFLFKCLNKYKKEGSILFLNINFSKLDQDLIIRLHNEFADIFDFNMINTKSLFDTTYELVGEIVKMQSNLKLILDQQTSEKNTLNEYKIKIEKELNEIREEQKRMNSIQSTSNEKLQTIENKVQSSSEKTIEIINNEFKSKVQSLESKVDNSIQSLEQKKNEIDRQIQILKEKQDRISGRLDTLNSNQESMSQKINNFPTKEIST